jgi:hypothetical protein
VLAVLLQEVLAVLLQEVLAVLLQEVQVALLLDLGQLDLIQGSVAHQELVVLGLLIL